MNTLFRLNKKVLFLAFCLLPFSLSKNGIFGIEISIAGPFFLVWCFLNLIIQKYSINTKYLTFLTVFTFYVFYTMALSFMSIYPWASLSRASYGILAFFLVLDILTGDERRLLNYIKLVALFSFILSIYFIIHCNYEAYHFGYEALFNSRIVGGLMSIGWATSNTVAGTILLTSFFSMFLYSRFSEKKYLGILFLNFIAILFSLSRDAGILSMVSLLIFFIREKKFFLLFIIFVALLFLIVFFANHFPGVVDSRTSHLNNLNGRLIFWREGWSHILEYPASGIGYYNSIYFFGHSFHDVFLTSYIETGPIGFLSIAFFLIYPFFLYKKQKNNYFFYAIIFSYINLSTEDLNFLFPYILIFWITQGIFVKLSFGDKRAL